MRITLIGAGNVGWHLARALYRARHEIVQVYSRAHVKANALADQVGAEAISDLTSLKRETDVCILAVKDDVILPVFDQIKGRITDALVVHTAGSVPMDIFKGHTQYGVIWPVQTLSIAHNIDFHEVPLAITGNTAEATYFIETFSRSISDHVYRIDDAKRAFLHLAATIACNFSNHMYALAEQITDTQDIPFDILKPLIQETALKILRMSPEEAQTGAARRHDTGTMSRHLALLENRRDLQDIYRILSKSIEKSTQNNHR